VSTLIRWEGERCFTLDKPPGLPVFPPHAQPEGDCMLRRMLAEKPDRAEVAWPFGFGGGIAHRLDISTSGQLVVARTLDDLAWLRDLFRRKWLHKRYRLFTTRAVPWATNETDLRIAHDRRRKGRMVAERGKQTPHRGKWYPAHTAFSEPAPTAEGTLWTAHMRTGVMHQIRVHAAMVGIALAGDRRYGGGPCPVPRPEGVQFLLHHTGLSSSGFEPAPAPLPSFWPRPVGH